MDYSVGLLIVWLRVWVFMWLGVYCMVWLGVGVASNPVVPAFGVGVSSSWVCLGCGMILEVCLF